MENMAPEVKVVMNLPEPGPKKATTQMPLPRMRPMMQSAAGARLILKYDPAGNSFKGTVENTTNGVLDRVRIEVHLSNGTELGSPTTPRDMAPGEVVAINLRATQASFTGWTAHAEVGTGGEGSEMGGEHQGGGEHSGDRESGGEHGSGGERRGGG